MDSEQNLSNRSTDAPPSRAIEGIRERVIGDSVEIRQGIVQTVEANSILVRQGGILTSHANQMDMNAGGVLWNKAETISLNNSSAAAVIVKGSSSLDQSSVKVMAAGGQVVMDQSAAGILVAKDISLKNSAVVFLIEKNLNGNINPMFGPREAAFFGAAAGLVGAIVFLIGRLFVRKSG